MKHYKPSFVTGAIINGSRLILIFLGMTPFILFFTSDAEPSFFPYILMIIFIPALSSYALGLLVTLIAMPFTDIIVCLDDEAIIVDNDKQKLKYTEVNSISLYLGEWSRTSIKPPYVTLWCENRKYTSVTRPSFFFLFKIVKRCKNAVFTIEELKKEILFILGIALGLGLLFSICTYFGI